MESKMAKTVSFGKTAEELEIYAERGIQRRIDAGDMTPEDADLIRQFVAHQRANGNIGDARAYKTANSLSNITRFCKTPLIKNRIGDIYLAVTAIKRGKRIAAKNGNNGGGTLSQDTQRDYITFLKRFYLWMIEEGYIDLPADKIAKIKVPAAKRMTKTAEQMLTEDEIRAMIHSCTSSTATRDRALISVLYESAMRIHEVAALKWSDVKFDTHFVRLNTAGKTGIPRYVPLTASRGYLAEWRSAYPGEASGANFVFVTAREKPLTYNYTKNLLQRIAERAGIQKHVTPHLFRHSRITNMIRQGFGESTVKMVAWGSLTSEQLARYTHLVNADIDAEFARHAGIDLTETQTAAEPLANRICARCHAVNQPDRNFCGVCGHPLTKETVLELDEMKAEIHADERFMKLIADLERKIEALQSIS